jgi:hypothetical protein
MNYDDTQNDFIINNLRDSGTYESPTKKSLISVKSVSFTGLPPLGGAEETELELVDVSKNKKCKLSYLLLIIIRVSYKRFYKKTCAT